MMEVEWEACEDPEAMLRVVRDKASDRKKRLLACACCRARWHLLADERSRAAVRLAEDDVEGQADPGHVADVMGAANVAFQAAEAGQRSRYAVTARDALGGVDCCWALIDRERPDEHPRQAVILRDLFGDLFGSVLWRAAWRTPSVCELARATYEMRWLPSGHLDNARLGVLSDALEEAGCTDEALLGHLRNAGPHVRGCWAVDLVLAKDR